ncbi:hypothetical protein Salat_1592700 [Sesamum alatum]|uniref:Uncharacterized protein n=1 Tax=Sesamum alatum TaxID=300844 RepID=A0AAE2CJ22_9LAMI|nr:hypothetical protein Salat_1592700 [Sesamum alatum]
MDLIQGLLGINLFLVLMDFGFHLQPSFSGLDITLKLLDLGRICQKLLLLKHTILAREPLLGQTAAGPRLNRLWAPLQHLGRFYWWAARWAARRAVGNGGGKNEEILDAHDVVDDSMLVGCFYRSRVPEIQRPQIALEC